VRASRIAIVPDGVDVGTFMPFDSARVRAVRARRGLKDDFVVLTVGGIVPHKGQDVMIEVVARLARWRPNVRFINIGPVRDQEYYRTLKAKAAAAGVVDRCVFVLGADSPTVAEFYNACDVYVQPSREEGFCMAALEAISCGRRVVGTNTGAMPEYIVGAGAGAVVRPEAEDICEAVRHVSAEDAEAERDRRHVWVRENYCWDVVASKLLKLYSAADK
jgi:glycosyltransferase involved in cell wall biosynthesis